MLKWQFLPGDKSMKEAFIGYLNNPNLDPLPNDAFMVHYTNGWKIIHPAELRGKVAQEPESLKKMVDDHFQAIKDNTPAYFAM